MFSWPIPATALRALRGTEVKHRQLPNSGLLLRFTIQKDSITKLGPTWDSNPGPSSVQPYMLATTPPRQLSVSVIPSNHPDPPRSGFVLL
ncbi:unnamed protein product, partial [Brenthis ino]